MQEWFSVITVVLLGREARRATFVSSLDRLIDALAPPVLFRAKRRYWQGRKSAASDLWSFTIFLDFRPLFSDFRKA